MELRRLRLRAPDEFADLAVTADLLHVTGDQEGAARLYLADIAARQDDVLAWIGLGLADRTARTVLKVPEVVMAVHAEIARRTDGFPDPRAVAAWVGN
jgi:hypothetical protein